MLTTSFTRDGTPFVNFLFQIFGNVFSAFRIFACLKNSAQRLGTFTFQCTTFQFACTPILFRVAISAAYKCLNVSYFES